MSDYIERDRLPREVSGDGMSDTAVAFAAGYNTCLEHVKLIPAAADVVLVVRCRDCEYWDLDWQSSYGDDCHYCPMVDMETWDNWYCFDGKRREVNTCT